MVGMIHASAGGRVQRRRNVLLWAPVVHQQRLQGRPRAEGDYEKSCQLARSPLLQQAADSPRESAGQQQRRQCP